MKKKISPILIIIVLLVLVALVLFIYSMTHEGNTVGEDDPSTVIESQIPKLELSLNTNDKNQSKVTITAIASMDDGSAIESITLPSGEVMTGAEKVNKGAKDLKTGLSTLEGKTKAFKDGLKYYSNHVNSSLLK